MPSKAKKTTRVEDKIDESPTLDQLTDQVAEAPTEEDLAVDPAPSIEEIAAQAPDGPTDTTEPMPLELPLDALSMLVWIAPTGERFHLEPTRTRGDYQLRPYFGD